MREILRQPVYEAKAVLSKQAEQEGVAISHWRLQLGHAWTVPAVVSAPPARETCLVVTDGGKQSLATKIEPLLAAGKRVIAVDLLGFGEADPGSGPDRRDDVMLMLIATIGQRPLGIQVAQFSAVARWATGNAAESPPSLLAVGPLHRA